jgi:hypothetical protein
MQLRQLRQQAEGQHNRQQAQRCAVGSPDKNLYDVLSEKSQRCAVGSQLLLAGLA